MIAPESAAARAIPASPSGWASSWNATGATRIGISASDPSTVVLAFGPVGGKTPDSKDSPAKITSFYVDHHSKEFVAAVLVAIGALFLAIFVASLRERLRSAGGAEIWSNLALVGGSVAVAGAL